MQIPAPYSAVRMQDGGATPLGDGKHTMSNGGCKVAAGTQLASTMAETEIPILTMRSAHTTNGGLGPEGIANAANENDNSEKAGKVVSDFWEKSLDLERINTISNAVEESGVVGRATITLGDGSTSPHWVTLTGYSEDTEGFIKFEYIPSSTNDTNNDRKFYLAEAPEGANNYVIDRIETFTREEE
jgi:hypothetical protein